MDQDVLWVVIHMRGVLAKAVRKRFHQHVRRESALFEPDRSAVVPRGWKVYRWGARRDLSFYIVLCIDPDMDRFTIECAWSRRGVFPSTVWLQNPRAWPKQGIRRDEPIGGEFRFRIGYLWQPEDFWWWLTPEAQFRQRLERFTDAVIAQNVSETLRSMEDEPIDDAIANVGPMVEDAVQKIVNYAIPYFEGILKR